MSNSIITNSGAIVARQLFGTANARVETISNRISSGNKVDTPFDDGATFSVAAKIRGDIASWAALGERQRVGLGIVDTAAAAATSISNTLIDLRETYLRYAGSNSDTERTQYGARIQQALGQITSFVENAEFNDTNLLEPVTNTYSPSGFGITYNTDQSFTVTEAGTITVNFSEISQNPGTVFVSAEQGGSAIYFSGFNPGTGSANIAWNPASGTTLDIISNNTQWSLSFAPSGPATTSDGQSTLSVPKNTDGDTITLANQDLSLAGLALDTLDLSDTTATLAAIEAAESRVGTSLNEMASTRRRIDNAIRFGSDLSDALTRAVGFLTDADLAKESANLQSAQVQQQLAAQGLSIANQAPQILLGLFR